MTKRRPFLTIVTRCCKRPAMLAQTIQSVLDQDCHDLEQIFLVDRVGEHSEGNMAWANSQFARYRDRVVGRYVFMLDDDGVLIDPAFVGKLRARIREACSPGVVLLRSKTLKRRSTKYHSLPPDGIWNLDWEHGQRPREWAGHGYNYAVRAPLWKEMVTHYEGVQRGGDWHFGTALIGSGVRIVRLMDTFSAKSLQRGYGTRFEGCGPGWFEPIAKKFGLVHLGHDDWRLRLYARKI